MELKVKHLTIFPAVLLVASLVSGCQSEPTQVEDKQIAPLSAPAELIALENATIGPPNVRRMWQYKIEKMAPENKLVKEGEVIVVFDSQQKKNDFIDRKSQLDAQIKQGENQRLKDEARQQDLILALAEAEMNFEKSQRKVEIVDVSRSDIDKKKQEADFRYQQEMLVQAKQRLAHHEKAIMINKQVSDGKISHLRRKVKSTKQEISKLTVKAPKSGLVMYLDDWNGEKPAVGETVHTGRALMQLPSLNAVALKAQFAEPDTAKLRKGQRVKVMFEAYPETSYEGKIAKLGQAFYPKSATNQKVVFDAEIELGASRPEVMRPGMKAKVEVIDS